MWSTSEALATIKDRADKLEVEMKTAAESEDFQTAAKFKALRDDLRARYHQGAVINVEMKAAAGAEDYGEAARLQQVLRRLLSDKSTSASGMASSSRDAAPEAPVCVVGFSQEASAAKSMEGTDEMASVEEADEEVEDVSVEAEEEEEELTDEQGDSNEESAMAVESLSTQLVAHDRTVKEEESDDEAEQDTALRPTKVQKMLHNADDDLGTTAHELVPNAQLDHPLSSCLHEESSAKKGGRSMGISSRPAAVHAGHVLLHFQSSVGARVPTKDYIFRVSTNSKNTASTNEATMVLNALSSGYITCTEAHAIKTLTAIQTLTRRVTLSDKKEYQLARIVWQPPLPWRITRDAVPAPARVDVYLCDK